MSELSLENPVFSNFLFYSGVVLSKTIFMSIWTSAWRVCSLVFASPEDYERFGRSEDSTEGKETIERIKRCHVNDMENVYPFVLLGLLYVTTKPDPQTALMVFRIFAASRIIHSIVYVNAIRQPCRVIAFGVGFWVNVYMGLKVITNGVW